VNRPYTTQTQERDDTQCLICGTRNEDAAVQCIECSAPMALVRDGTDPQSRPKVVTILGDSNVGKTVYLGFLLDMLSQHTTDYQAIPIGAYSVNVQQNVISHMACRMFPPKTPMEADQWHWAYYQICKRTSRKEEWLDLVIPDIAGESLTAELANPNTFRVINSLAGKSAGMLLLLDAPQAANGSSQPDFFGVKMLTYLDAVHRADRRSRVQMPTAVVLCKADMCPECFDDPRHFTEVNLSRLWNLCQSRLGNVEFFACSAVGSLAYATSPEEDFVTPIPLHTALRGVLEPFEWVVQQL
jgi:hypothetical protein